MQHAKMRNTHPVFLVWHLSASDSGRYDGYEIGNGLQRTTHELKRFAGAADLR